MRIVLAPPNGAYSALGCNEEKDVAFRAEIGRLRRGQVADPKAPRSVRPNLRRAEMTPRVVTLVQTLDNA